MCGWNITVSPLCCGQRQCCLVAPAAQAHVTNEVRLLFKHVSMQSLMSAAFCRYWISDTYEARHTEGREPESIDKEFLRLWFRERCNPYKDKVPLTQTADCILVGLIPFAAKLELPSLGHPSEADTSLWRHIVLCVWVVLCLLIMVQVSRARCMHQLP